MKKANMAVAAVFAFIAVAAIVLSSSLPPAKDGVPGPGSWPVIIAVVMLGASVMIALHALKNTSNEKPSINMLSRDCVRVYLSMAFLIVYFVLMYVLGFGSATFIMLCGFISWFGRYKWYKTAAVSLVVTAAVYAVFKYILKVPFRFGILF